MPPLPLQHSPTPSNLPAASTLPPLPGKVLGKTTQQPQAQYLVDGVCLSEGGMNHVRSLQLDQPRRRVRGKGKVPATDAEAGIWATIESVVSGGIQSVNSASNNDSTEAGSLSLEGDPELDGINGIDYKVRLPMIIKTQ